MPPPTATASGGKLRAVKIGACHHRDRFGLAARVSPEMDHSLSGLRGSSIQGANGSFSQQLKEVIITELKAAGLYDEVRHPDRRWN